MRLLIISALLLAWLPATPAAGMVTTTASGRHVEVGTFVEGGGEELATGIAAYGQVSGEPAEIVHTFTDWADRPFPASRVATILASGATPLVSWEPRRWESTGAPIPDILAAVVAGEYDVYLRQWAAAAKAAGAPVYVRLGHEMNGSWYPWGQVPGNAPPEYVAMYRHVHDVVTAAGADNVRWVWCPNVIYDDHSDPRPYYPGEAYVDVVALDGYNWGSDASSGWQSLGEVMDATLALLPATKPVWIVETGSTEHGGDKAAWVRDAFRWVAARPRIAAVVWFNTITDLDWRIDSSATAASAFRAGLAELRLGADTPAPTVTAPSEPPIASPPAPVATRPTLHARQLARHTSLTRRVLLAGGAGMPAARVVVQRRVGHHWRRVAVTRTADGSFAVRGSLPRHRVVLRAVVAGRASTPVRMRVR